MPIIEFTQDLDEHNMPNEMLAGLARDAYKEMQADWRTKPWKAYAIKNKQAGQAPAVMVALLKGRKIYFSSSIRSATEERIGFAYDAWLSPIPVQMALNHCMLRTSSGDEVR